MYVCTCICIIYIYKQKDIVLQLEIKNSILWLKDKVEKILQKDEKIKKQRKR